VLGRQRNSRSRSQSSATNDSASPREGKPDGLPVPRRYASHRIDRTTCIGAACPLIDREVHTRAMWATCGRSSWAARRRSFRIRRGQGRLQLSSLVAIHSAGRDRTVAQGSVRCRL
jgi:hypothetical protein